MPSFKTLLAASLLLISTLPGITSAGLYSSDRNTFATLKTGAAIPLATQICQQ